MNRAKFLRYVDTGILVFIGISVFTSQFSVATSSIGVGGLIILIAARFILNEDVKFFDWNIFYLFLLFILIQIIGSFLSDTPLESFSNIYRRISLYPVFFAVFMFIENKKQLYRMLAVFFIFSAFISSVELYRYIADYVNHMSTKPIGDNRLEYYGFPITNAEIKMLIILLIVPLVLSKEKFVLNKAVLIIIGLLVLLTMVLTDSRNAMLGLFCALVLIGILRYRYFLGVIAVVLVLFFAFGPSSLKERVISIVDLNHPSNHSRIVMWETGAKMINDKPVLGFGDVDNIRIYTQYKKPEFHGEGSHMHSNAMQLLVMFGLLGFLSWLAIMLYILYRQIKIYKLTKQFEWLNLFVLASMASMVAFQVSGLTEWNFGDAEFSVVMWFNLALVFLTEKLMISEKRSVND